MSNCDGPAQGWGDPYKIPEKDPTAINVQTDAEHHLIEGTTYHGNIDFSCPAWSFIDKNLWQGGYVHGLRLSQHFKHLISLYPWEKYKVEKRLSTELYVTMYDDPEQALDQVDSLARLVNTCRESGPTFVHCQAGLNRSSLVVARSLFLSGDDAFDTGDKIVDYLRIARSPACLCNPAFEEEVRSWRRARWWITVGWSPSWPDGYTELEDGRCVPTEDGPREAVMSLNGRPRAYYDLKQAERAIGGFSKDARIVELDFSAATVEARWIDE
jgi:protein-tyrosine phosphatase